MVRSEEQLRRLATPEFSRLLASDPELQRLNALKYDRRTDCRLLLEAIAPERESRIGRLSVRPLTAAKWSLLWLLESPFVSGEEPAESDCDIALYLLCRKHVEKISVALCQIPVLASGYLARTAWPTARVVMEVRRQCETAFRPLALLPHRDGTARQGKFRFDAVWLNRVAGIAAGEANTSLFEAMHVLPLSVVCCCYVNYLQRVNCNTLQLHFRPDAELSERISARIATLETEFLR